MTSYFFTALTELAATGATVNILIPIIGGVLLLGGIAAIVITQVRRRQILARNAPPVAPTPEAPSELDQ